MDRPKGSFRLQVLILDDCRDDLAVWRDLIQLFDRVLNEGTGARSLRLDPNSQNIRRVA